MTTIVITVAGAYSAYWFVQVGRGVKVPMNTSGNVASMLPLDLHDPGKPEDALNAVGLNRAISSVDSASLVGLT